MKRISLLGISFFFCVLLGYRWFYGTKVSIKKTRPLIQKPYLNRISKRILPGETLSQALARYEVEPASIYQITHALSKEVNLRAIRPGDGLVLEFDPVLPNVPQAFELIRLDALGIPVRYRAALNADTLEYHVDRLDLEVSRKVTLLSGKIEYSLYESMLKAGGTAAQVSLLAEMFGWQIDFYRETQPGDQFKLITQSQHVEGRFAGYGQLYAAEYIQGKKVLRAYYYENKDKRIKGYFGEKGESLERAFLVLPIEFARITSRYGQRFHPILKRQKSHNGVDYGAPTGTPFRAVADGVVIAAGYNGAAGNMIRLQHSGGYMTEYFHASRIAKGIRQGVRVKQRQVIGYVGTTGRSTGPHLHYGMKFNGRYVDPGKQKFKSGNPLPAGILSSYQQWIKPLKYALDTGDVKDL